VLPGGSSVCEGENSVSDLVVGIDLGTTFSAVAYVDDCGQPRIIPNREGQSTTPSVVLIDEGRIEVGDAALSEAGTKPDCVLRWVKRAMGRPAFRFQGLTAAQISAEILKKLKRDAEQRLASPVCAAVITCPAYFSSPEIEATKQAGQLAGLEVREIVKEPTAAAVYYGVDHLREGQKLLVYDLGGGTFDATILLLEEGVFKPLASAGDSHLGGHDWTEDLMKRVLRDLIKRYGEDPRIDPGVEHRLYEQCERAKRDLSRVEETLIPCVYGGRAEEVRVTRGEFEDMTGWRIDATLQWVEKAFGKAEKPMTWADCHGILLVGGATRMPRVREALAEASGKAPIVTGEADTMVALGAAVLAKGAMRPRTDKSALVAAGAKRDIVAVRFDRITPRTLGTKALAWVGAEPEIRNSPIIRLGTRLPATATRSDYQVSTEGQEFFDVPVVEFDDVGPEVVIGTYRFSCLPRTRAGRPISVTFSYDGSGIADVTALDQSAKQTLLRLQVTYQPPDLAKLKSLRRERVVVFALDVSFSMEGDKIERAKKALIASARALSENSLGTARIGVVTFDSQARCICELSRDLVDICSRIEQNVQVGGSTAMDDGIATAAGLLQGAGASAVREIALVTDGMPDDGTAALAAAKRARSKGIELHAVGIGRGDVDEDFLRQIAPGALTVAGAEGLGDALMTLLTEASNRTGGTNVVSWGESQ